MTYLTDEYKTTLINQDETETGEEKEDLGGTEEEETPEEVEGDVEEDELEEEKGEE